MPREHGRTEYVHIKRVIPRGLPVIEVLAVELHTVNDSRVVDEDVDATPVARDLFHQEPQLLSLAQVSANKQVTGTIKRTVDGRRRVLITGVVDGDPIPQVGKGTRYRLTDASRGARYENTSPHHVSILPS